MRVVLILCFFYTSVVSFGQTDSLLLEKKWKGEHQLFAEVFGVGMYASVGYNYIWTRKRFSFETIVGLGGVVNKHKPFRAFVPYAGFGFGYQLNRLLKINLTCIGASYNSFYGIFGSEGYCIEENVNCPDKTVNYVSLGLHMDVRLNDKFDLNLGIYRPYRPYKIYPIKFVPSIKLKFRL